MECYILADRQYAILYIDCHLTHWPLGDWNFKSGIFNLILGIGGWGISREIGLKWKSEGITDDKSTLGRQQAITWPNVDPYLCLHMASLGPNENWPEELDVFACRINLLKRLNDGFEWLWSDGIYIVRGFFNVIFLVCVWRWFWGQRLDFVCKNIVTNKV